MKTPQRHAFGLLSLTSAASSVAAMGSQTGIQIQSGILFGGATRNNSVNGINGTAGPALHS